MASKESKEIAKDILLKMLEQNVIQPSQFPNAATTVDVVCEAYKKLVTAVAEA